MADKAAEPRAVRQSAARRAEPRSAAGRTTRTGFARSSFDGTGLPPTVQDQGNHAVGAFLRRRAGRAEPLPPSLRSGMESYFGTDLSGVRLHVSGDAARSANAQRARAYTVDQDVVFGAGEYRPHDAAGRRLIAHEVAHTVQQACGGPDPAGSERTE
ncbi:eCIS core domain-containing protein, partial [Streptomyces massasporeus]|uniref:eCIS core domain-containing protein n=1 Tax=Streptomyces massasporeus TaxID=67324 RepID=UPI00332062C0